MARKDLLTKLADAGEEALSRLTDAPGADKITAFATSTRDRLDELTKRVRGIEELESRLSKLEKQVAALSGTKSTPARKSSPAKRSTSRKTSSSSRSSTKRAGGGSPG
jgi:BMFP domain-containing protein YqiC